MKGTEWGTFDKTIDALKVHDPVELRIVSCGFGGECDFVIAFWWNTVNARTLLLSYY